MTMNLRRHPILIALLATATLASATSAQQRITIGQLLSSPFPAGLVAAPNHGKVAWVQNAEGRRNIWVAAVPDYRGQQITQYSEDDGQEVTDLQFGPGANHIVYVRGGAPNRQQEIPNPTSDPDGTQRAIWIIEATGGESRKLAEGSSPAISPDGESTAFIKGGQIWSVPSVAESEPEQLTHTRGGANSLRWSPDGSMLAFASSRGDHSFIGVYNLGEHTVRYLDPSVHGDGSPAWSPDSRHIAFIRVPNERQRLPFAPRRTALPWSIRVVDVGTGRGRAVFTADKGNGSAFRGVVAENQLFWGAGDNLVFPWELDGWTHLYSVPAGGGRAQLLTPGEFDVEHVFLSADGREVLFSSNQDDIDRRHLWRVAVSGGSPEAITSGRGIEWSPVLTGDRGAIAFLASDAREPAHAEIIVGSENRRVLAPQSRPREFPADTLVEPQQVIFSGADGMRIHGQLFLPADMRSGERHPAVLFFHGGSRRQMLLGWHYGGYYHNAYALNQYLASRGYIVLSVNYRSGIGYGMEFREALNYGARGASEFNDVLGAGLYLQSRHDVDPQRIGLWGGSYGGYLTALGLAKASDLFAAGVDLHGVHDWNIVIRNFVPSYDATTREEFSRLAFESSPMAYIESWRSPVLLIHGDDDRNVPFSESVDLAESLAKQGVEFEQLIFPDEVHGFLLHRHWVAAYEAAADFFERKLKGREPRAGER
jgi:dipeptidyl aminopeptidase/acylaminoacyl peptidase